MNTTTPDIGTVRDRLATGQPDGLDSSSLADPTPDGVRVMLRDSVHNVVVEAAFNGQTLTEVAITPSGPAPDGRPVRLSAVTLSRLNALLKGSGLEAQLSARTGAHNLRAGAYSTCALSDGLTARTVRAAGHATWSTPILSGGRAAPVAPVSAPTVTVAEPTSQGPQPTLPGGPEPDHTGLVPTDTTPVILPKSSVRKYEAVRLAHREHGHRSLIALRGPAGSGKTMAAKHFAAQEGLPFFKFDCAGVRDPDNWFGTWATTAGADGSAHLEFRGSDLLRAISYDGPALLLLDEVNRAAGNAVVALLPVLDLSGRVTVPQTGRSTRINPDLQVVMTMNMGSEYMHVEPLDLAFQDRMGMTIKVPHLTQVQEKRLLLDRVPGLSVYHADLLTQLTTLIREGAAHGGKHRSVSTRRVLDAAQYIAAGLRPIEAVEGAILDWYDDEGGARSEQSQVRHHMTGLVWDDPAAQVAAEATREGLATLDPDALIIDGTADGGAL